MSAGRRSKLAGPVKGIAVFALAFAVYYATMSRAVGVGDSAEFQTMPYVLGIAHPTGYPTHILVGRLFAAMPFGTPAARITLMSAAFGSLTVLLLYAIVMKVTGDFVASSASALTLAYSRVFWGYSVTAEAYTLNTFFLLLSLLLLLEWRSRRDDRLLYAFGLAYGLGLGNHMSLLLCAPVYALAILASDRGVFLSRRILPLALCLILGLSVYLYVLIRDTPETPMNYIHEYSLEHGTFNYSRNSLPDRVERLVWITSGKQFKAGEKTLNNFKRLNTIGLKTAFGRMLDQFTLLGILLAAAGLLRLAFKDKFVLAVTALIFALNLQRFGGEMIEQSIPMFVILSLWSGFGVNALTASISRGRSRCFCIGRHIRIYL